MIKLSDTCTCSELKVTPADWQNCRTITRDWQIYYRVYDKAFTEQYPKGKLVVIKGMNKYKELKQRRACTQSLIDDELQQLRNGYNPISGQQPTVEIEIPDEINKKTGFIDALNHAKGMLRVSPNTMKGEIEWVIGQIETAAGDLGYKHTSIWDITLKHLHLICEKASIKVDKSYSGDKFNRNKKVLRLLYKKLLILEVVPFNLPISLDRQKGAAKKERQLFTKGERAAIIEHLQKSNPRFLLFIQIFFSSGSRLTEMMRVKVKDVDFANQYITYLVLKGKQYEYKQRPMVDIAVGLWSDAVYGANPDDYVWGKGLLPGAEPSGKYTVKMKWSRLREKLGILKGFYALKHTNSTEVADMIGTEGVMTLNAESRAMIESVYDTKHKKRKDDTIKGVNNPL